MKHSTCSASHSEPTPSSRRGRWPLTVVAAVALGTVVVPSAALDRRPTAAADEPVLAQITGGATVSATADRIRPTYRLVFPVDPVPRCYVLDNFGDPRSGGRRHAGVDILTTQGQAVYAAMDGLLTRKTIAGNADAVLSGNAWGITGVDGDYYYYGHLSAFAPGLELGGIVRAGDVIGYVGDTGNPGVGNYHLHFEIRRGGFKGVVFDPLPLLPVPARCTVW
jgi:murein DD-endopeptidase MepM/ murein hydrolase activator NlpD